MKYKRINTQDYLVNAHKFCDLLENMALEGWFLKEIELGHLTFKKGTPQRKRYKIYYNQFNKDLKNAGYHLVFNYFGLQVVEYTDLFIESLQQDVKDQKKVLTTIYNFSTHYLLMIMAIVLLFAYQPFKIHGIPHLSYLVFYFGTYLFNIGMCLIGFYLLFFGLCNLSHSRKITKDQPYYLEKYFSILSRINLYIGVSVILLCLLLQDGLNSFIILIVSLFIGYIGNIYKEKNHKSKFVVYLCVIVSLGLGLYHHPDDDLYIDIEPVQSVQSHYGYDDHGALYTGFYIEDDINMVEGYYKGYTRYIAENIFKYQVENIFKNKKSYQDIIQQYPLIKNQKNHLCFRYKQKYIILKDKEVYCINNHERIPLSKFIKYYSSLEI